MKFACPNLVNIAAGHGGAPRLVVAPDPIGVPIVAVYEAPPGDEPVGLSAVPPAGAAAWLWSWTCPSPSSSPSERESVPQPV